MIRIMKLLAGFLGIALVIWIAKFAYDYKVSKLQKAESLPTSTVTASVRERQLDCLATNIYYEAGYEPFEGKVAVAQVTVNRAASGKFPGDICKVVYQKNIVYDRVLCQFSWYCEGKSGVKPRNSVAFEQSMEAAKKVLLEGFKLPSLENAMYFHSVHVSPKWNKERVAKVGNHIFYSDLNVK